MERLSAIEAFATVVEEGGFTAAADKLRVAKSAISKHIQALEGDLGVRLLNRTTRKVNPTEEGELYYARVRRVLDDLVDAREAIHALTVEPRGLLRLSAPMSFGIEHLTTALAEFMVLYPDLTVEAVFDDRFVDLVDGGFDLAIRSGKLQDSSLRARRVAPVRFCLVASPAYIAKHGEPKTPDDLADHKILHYGLLATGEVWQLRGPAGEARARVKPSLIANNGDVIRDAAIHGNGIALQPTFLCWRALEAGTLVPVMPDWYAPDTAIHAVYPPGRFLSPKVRAFIDFFVERCGLEPYWDEPIKHLLQRRT